MRKTAKKIFSLVAAATLVTSTLAMTACGGDFYKQATSVNYEADATKDGLDNGGFAVEKDGYVYFINGKETHTADNVYGDVVKGSLMRIKTSDLNAGKYDNATEVIPMLFVAQNYNAGIFIYGDYVYYATPTTAKNMHGEVSNTYIDFKSARLDGTETMKNYYFRLSSNSANYRFVEVEDVVYCMYEEDGALKSYNTSTGDTTVLVKGGTYTFDTNDLSNPNVYYTMNVSYNVDSDAPTKASYNQVYKVNAAATVDKATFNAKEASYTVKGGRTYDFDQNWMKEQNDAARETAKKNGKEYEAVYNFDDYSTYPYVNLGSLVMNGVGKNYAGDNYSDTRFNDDQTKKVAADDCKEFIGYTYTISRYDNDGIYYTKADDTKLYYLAESATAAPIKADSAASVVTSKLATDIISKALFEVNGDVHTYLYIENDQIKKGSSNSDDVITLCKAPTNATLWKTVDSVLYYYAAGTNPVTSAASTGMQLSRIDYTGEAKEYQNLSSLIADEKYKPVTISYVDFVTPDSWYKPEMYGNTLLFANTEAIGGNSYNYIYATDISFDKITANNEKYEAAYEAMDDATEKDSVKKAMTYYYRTGDVNLIEELKDSELYTAEEYDVFEEYVAKSKATDGFGTVAGLTAEGVYTGIGQVGAINDADKETIEEDWRSTLPVETSEEEEDEGLATWIICVIIAAAVVVVAAAVTATVIIVNNRKAAKAEAEATVNAYKRKKVDTTDDKTIDVYADEEEEVTVETVEETSEEAIEAEVVEEAVEEAAEETVETVPETTETTEE